MLEFCITEQLAGGGTRFRLTREGAPVASFPSCAAALNSARSLARESHSRGESAFVRLRLREAGDVVESLLHRRPGPGASHA